MSQLVVPHERYRASFLAGAAEFEAEGRLGSTYCLGLGVGMRRLERQFGHFVRDLVALGEAESAGSGRYVDRVLWLVDEDAYVGQASIRPELASRYLITYGGHIGYSIRPSRRGQGYGTEILALAVAQARCMGLRRVLVTCDSDNVASRRVIERNGGEYETALPMPPEAFQCEGREPRAGIDKLRYWIDLTDTDSSS